MSSPNRNPKYKIGDIVYLVTGGPSMSVEKPLEEYVTNDGTKFRGNYRCQWFAGKKLDSGTFPEESLTNIAPKP